MDVSSFHRPMDRTIVTTITTSELELRDELLVVKIAAEVRSSIARSITDRIMIVLGPAIDRMLEPIAQSERDSL
jgi:hypothetical protein